MTHLRLVLATLCALAAVLTVVVVLTGGFELRFGGIRVLASRRLWKPALIALLSGLGAWVLSPADERRLILSVRWHPLLAFAQSLSPRLAPLVAALAAVSVVTVGLLRGAFVVVGTDVYGYVSQAHLWATGTWRIEQPFMRDMRWTNAAHALAPLGYLPGQDGTSIVPFFPPGFPMVMGVFERLAGREAVFYVVPLLGGLAVWATYLMGTRLAGRMVGASAAVLLATSPPFLVHLMSPMSDVPATSWWALTLALLLGEGRTAALGAGFAAAAAFLTRVNLVPLAAVPGVLLVWQAARERSLTGRAAQRALLFGFGVISGGVVLAIINTRWYGSPLTFAWNPIGPLYSWNNLWPNLASYSRWLLETETPVVLLAFIAPLAMQWRGREDHLGGESRAVAIMWVSFIAAVFLAYLFFMPHEGWVWIRYLLPAFPPLFVLTIVTLRAMLARLRRGVRVTVIVAVVGLLAWHGVKYGLDRVIFNWRDGDRTTVALSEYITRSLPSRAVFLSMWHSGSIRYYSGRLTVRYDHIPPDELDKAIEDLRRLGYRPYIVLEDHEERDFLARFSTHSILSALDWPPVVLLDNSTKVRIYNPADREGPFPGR